MFLVAFALFPETPHYFIVRQNFEVSYLGNLEIFEIFGQFGKLFAPFWKISSNSNEVLDFFGYKWHFNRLTHTIFVFPL